MADHYRYNEIKRVLGAQLSDEPKLRLKIEDDYHQTKWLNVTVTEVHRLAQMLDENDNP